ncbi:hypothetical protein [Lentibacillus sp.]|uniref:hypothetical protein n=1 Tax=Lentibacillus sp. TaxID=1925746 RepID=UPI0039C9CEF0
MKPEDRRKIVEEELKQLKEAQYIEKNVYFHVLEAHDQLYADRKQAESTAKDAYVEMNDVEKSKEVPAQPKKVKKTLSPQEVRERNITWALNLGVILLLIGGLVLATSTWDILDNWMKTGLIALVSALFFGLASFTRRILKIRKTAFAFYVLGGLFLPIIILSAGYFELIGTYFSFFGEGRYVYGTAGSLAILPVYLFLAVKLASRLFVWFSYITFTIFAGFFIAAFHLPIDGFYFGIMVFNATLITGYHYLKKQERFQLFIREFVVYVQASLILSTLLMLTIYDHELVYSFNLFLTAVLYFAMIFVTNHKGYHVVFSVMLVYGAYQLIEFSALNEVGDIAYALLGFVFLALPKLVKDSSSLQKAFRYTSAIVSALAFLYISMEGILLRMNEPSVILLLAYVIIALNFLYLSNNLKRKLFHYLSPVFFMAALYEAVLLGQEIFGYEHLSLPLFIAGLFLYIVFGCWMKPRLFQPVKASARDVGGMVMLICILGSYGFIHWWQVGSMFLLLAVVALFMAQFEKRALFIDASLASWMHAVALGFAVFAYYTGSKTGENVYGPSQVEAESFILAGIIVLLVSFLWRQFQRKAFYDHGFFVSHGFYLLGMLMTFSFLFNDFMRALIVLGGIGMAYLLYRKTKWVAMPYIISGLSMVFYLTIVYAIYTEFTIQTDLYHALQFVTGAGLLLSTGSLIGKKDSALMKSYWWAGHLYLPVSLMITFLLYGSIAVWAFIVGAVLYGISVQKAERNWMVNTFLYFLFTSVWIAVSQGMFLLELGEHMPYSFLILSIAFAVAWYVSKGRVWKRRIAYYKVPFTFIGIIAFTFVMPYDLISFVVTLLYVALLLFLLHQEKWDIYNLFPLLIVFYVLGLYGSNHSDWEYFMLLAVAGFAGLYTVIGMLTYPFIYGKGKEKVDLPVIDWYTVIGFIALCGLYGLTKEALWTKLLPGLLISGNLMLQRKRVPDLAPKWFLFTACTFLLQPYYTVLIHTDVIPTLIEREMYVLPWIVLVIFLKKITDKSYKSRIKNIQWAVLVIVSLLLIQDGMASNTIYDALIIGTLSLASILGGIFYQIKSFFFVGAGVLLLNVFLQTRPYWGNLPWWGYLLIAGSILIIVASYNEWHKQKTSEGKETWITLFKKKVIEKLKKWE